MDELFLGYSFCKEKHISISKPFYSHEGELIGYPFNINDIMSRDLCRCIPKLAGLYHLFDYFGNLIYIGISDNIHRRIKEHFIDETMDFTYLLYFIPKNKSYQELRNIERNAIKIYKPIMNIQYNNN